VKFAAAVSVVLLCATWFAGGWQEACLFISGFLAGLWLASEWHERRQA